MDAPAIGTTHRQTVLAFLTCFCDGNIDGLEVLLADDLKVSGPSDRFGSRDAYLARLRADPPEASTYRLLSTTETDDSVAVFYDLEKPDSALTVAQLFRFENGLIAEMRLVFDTDGMPPVA